MDTRPSVLSQEDVQRIAKEWARQGASINVNDPRVTSIQTWLLTAIGIAIIGLGTWLIKSVNDLNITMTRVVTQNEGRDAEAVRMREHIESLDRRIVALERSLSDMRRR